MHKNIEIGQRVFVVDKEGPNYIRKGTLLDDYELCFSYKILFQDGVSLVHKDFMFVTYEEAVAYLQSVATDFFNQARKIEEKAVLIYQFIERNIKGV